MSNVKMVPSCEVRNLILSNLIVVPVTVFCAAIIAFSVLYTENVIFSLFESTWLEA